MDEFNPYFPSRIPPARNDGKVTRLIVAICGLEIITRLGTFALVNRLVIAVGNATVNLLDGWSQFPFESGVLLFLFSIPFACIRTNTWMFWIATGICATIVYGKLAYGSMTNAGSIPGYSIPISVTMVTGSWLILMAFRHIHETVGGK